VGRTVVALHQEAVPVHGILDVDGGLPPDRVVGLMHDGGVAEGGLAVGVRACPDNQHGAENTRHPHAHPHVLAELRRLRRDIERGPVVMRQAGEIALHDARVAASCFARVRALIEVP
jgi:hypothetical protein